MMRVAFLSLLSLAALAGCEPTQPKPVAQDAAPALPTAAQRGAAVAPPATLPEGAPPVGNPAVDPPVPGGSEALQAWWTEPRRTRLSVMR